MNNDEMEILAAGIEKALADGLAAHDAAREARAAAAERAQAEAEEARGLAEKRLQALNGVVRTAEREQELYASIVLNAIDGYCSEARRAVLEALKNDPRMPRPINYLERYGAMMRMQDRDEVLQKIESTLDLADRILADVGAVDVQAALTEAAEAYAERVMGLEGVRVVESAGLESLDSDDDDGLRAIDVTDCDINKIIGEAFAEAWGGQTMLEVQMTQQLESARDKEEAINRQTDRAKKAATKSARTAYGRRARSVTGAVLTFDRPDPFDGAVGARLAKDPALVRALAAEVRTSFATFTQVVQDNGLFAAFSNENSYGACQGYRYDWWSDLFYDESDDEYCGDLPGRREYDDIPTVVKEGKSGDSLEMSIERMRAFNKRKYWGLLDDDFQEHVEAFWYGFKKLMENVNGLFEVDSRAFNAYCARVSAQVKDRAADLAVRMDGVQAQAFAQEIGARAQKGRTDDGANL